jgi:hypothetical protein
MRPLAVPVTAKMRVLSVARQKLVGINCQQLSVSLLFVHVGGGESVAAVVELVAVVVVVAQTSAQRMTSSSVATTTHHSTITLKTPVCKKYVE